MNKLDLQRVPLFEGLDEHNLADVYACLRPRRFEAREHLCYQGEPGSSLFIIVDGAAQVSVLSSDDRDRIVLAHLRRLDVVGEMSLLTGEPRSADVIAMVPTEVLELSQPACGSLLARFPTLLTNISRILSSRLAQANLKSSLAHGRGESVALILGRAAGVHAASIVEAAKAASPRNVAALDVRMSSERQFPLPEEHSVAAAVGMLDGMLASSAAVITVATADGADNALLIDQVDRVVLVADAAEARALAGLRNLDTGLMDHFLLGDEPMSTLDEPAGMRLVRQRATLNAEDMAWLGRHLSRTKLGLALGAGGAKGYAHVGAIHSLERAGYTIDYVAGSSIGGIVGAWLALGMSAADIERTMRQAFTPEFVAETFKLSLSGLSSGQDAMTSMLRASTHERSFDDCSIPLTVMCVDLNSKQPAPIRNGPLWQGLVGATALAGLFPPYNLDGRRLVDGLALVPVPVGSVIEAGADITVAVNLLGADVLPAWPGESPPPAPPTRGGARMLDTLLEVMDLSQLESSVRHASMADVAVTPQFGPGSWRDFHLADLFLASGLQATEQQLGSLRELAKPQSAN